MYIIVLIPLYFHFLRIVLQFCLPFAFKMYFLFPEAVASSFANYREKNLDFWGQFFEPLSVLAILNVARCFSNHKSQ